MPPSGGLSDKNFHQWNRRAEASTPSRVHLPTAQAKSSSKPRGPVFRVTGDAKLQTCACGTHDFRVKFGTANLAFVLANRFWCPLVSHNHPILQTTRSGGHGGILNQERFSARGKPCPPRCTDGGPEPTLATDVGSRCLIDSLPSLDYDSGVSTLE